MLRQLIVAVLHSRWFIVWSVVFRTAWPSFIDGPLTATLPPPAATVTVTPLFTTPALPSPRAPEGYSPLKKEEWQPFG